MNKKTNKQTKIISKQTQMRKKSCVNTLSNSTLCSVVFEQNSKFYSLQKGVCTGIYFFHYIFSSLLLSIYGDHRSQIMFAQNRKFLKICGVKLKFHRRMIWVKSGVVEKKLYPRKITLNLKNIFFSAAMGKQKYQNSKIYSFVRRE